MGWPVTLSTRSHVLRNRQHTHTSHTFTPCDILGTRRGRVPSLGVHDTGGVVADGLHGDVHQAIVHEAHGKPGHPCGQRNRDNVTDGDRLRGTQPHRHTNTAGPAMAPCTTFWANCMQYMLSEGFAGTLRTDTHAHDEVDAHMMTQVHQHTPGPADDVGGVDVLDVHGRLDGLEVAVDGTDEEGAWRHTHARTHTHNTFQWV